jgi:hypothetical protein
MKINFHETIRGSTSLNNVNEYFKTRFKKLKLVENFNTVKDQIKIFGFKNVVCFFIE